MRVSRAAYKGRTLPTNRHPTHSSFIRQFIAALATASESSAHIDRVAQAMLEAWDTFFPLELVVDGGGGAVVVVFVVAAKTRL